MTPIGIRVERWLEGSTDFGAIEPVVVTIGKESWEGVRFEYKMCERFYLVGEMPEGWKSTIDYQTYYTLGRLDFYVSCYMRDFHRRPDRYMKYHPFGNNFVLSEACVYDESRSFPCIRKEMTVR
jgi:hypothetical protein